MDTVREAHGGGLLAGWMIELQVDLKLCPTSWFLPWVPKGGCKA